MASFSGHRSLKYLPQQTGACAQRTAMQVAMTRVLSEPILLLSHPCERDIRTA